MDGRKGAKVSRKPAISVVMPVYNAEEYISEAVESVLDQTFEKFELIIVNDGSTDRTLEIVKKFGDKRVRVINNKINLKIARSLNKAVKLARAEIIARMDADDISLPTRFAKQYELLAKNQNVAVVGTNMQIINEKGKVTSNRDYPVDDKSMKKVMFRYSPFGHPTVVFRKKPFLEFGGYDPKRVPCEDIDLWFKIGSKYEFATVPERLLKYRVVSGRDDVKKLRALEMLSFRVRVGAIMGYGYVPSVYDFFYNLVQFLSMWFMGADFRIRAYNFLRSKRVI